MFQDTRTKPIKEALLGGLVLFFCLSIGTAYAGPFSPHTFPRIRVNGTVSSRLTKQGIPNASVSAVDRKGKTLSVTKTNTQGYYQLSILSGSAKPVFIRIEATGYQFQHKGGSLSPYRTYTINFTLTSTKPPPRPDTIPPISRISINDNQRFTNSTQVNLSLLAQDNPGGSGLFQMQFSNDNKAWSTPEAYTTKKAWTFSSGDGRKVVYAKFSDKAGNWSRVYSDEIILDTTASATPVDDHFGQLIGPEGGEVSSPDGKVKITIPQGALSASRKISILTIDKARLSGLVPAGKTLLNVVECKPAGLNFSLPVSIDYAFNEAQVPGTPVSLGLYEGGKIYLTSEPSVVPVDGYNVTFSIRHFSTYAALAGFTSQGAAIGGGVKIPLPDMLTGAFSHSIPITAPAGRKGMQPQIALTYRSSNSNSWVGQGFSLNPGYIVRSTRLGPPTYNDTQDTFYLVTDAGTTELVWLVDNLYQAKVESSFTKFYKEPDDSWKALGKDGSILRFGQVSDSKEICSHGTFSWHLSKAIDNNGNYIEYRYQKYDSNSYLLRIDYTGNENIGLSPANSLEFLLEDREDISSSYASTSRIATSKRLKAIEAKVNSSLVWKYELEYAYSPDTNRSLLKSVTQYGSDGKSLPAQEFGYQEAK